jgi:hypothetical protein
VTAALARHTEMYRQPGPWCTVYTDASTGTVDSLHADDVRPDNIMEALRQAGAAKQDLKAAAEALRRSAKGIPDPVSRLILIRDGAVALDEFLPGRPVMSETVAVEPVPNLTALVRHRPEEFPYVVAEVSRDGGEICLRYANQNGSERITEVEGETLHLNKVPGGGWSQGRYQHHTENVWRANASEIAVEIDRIVRSCHARLVVIAGDIRARNLVAEQVSDGTRQLVTLVDSHTRTDGADPEALARQVEQRVAETLAAHQQQLMERLNVQQGQANPESAVGIGAVVAALQQAQVGTLMLDSSAWDGETLLALDAEPWVASSSADTAGAGTLGEVSAQAALLRAAALTDADVAMFPSGALDSHRIAALLRWPVGPAAPAAT